MNEKHDWGISTLTDEDLISLKDAIFQEQGKRKSKRVKIAFEAFKKAARELDELLEMYYNIEGDSYTMDCIIYSIEESIKEKDYPL